MTKSIKKPWGSYVVLSKSKDFLIKKIIVRPEGVLSYQSHNFRSEHWIIIEGKATVIINNRTFYKSENENILSSIETEEQAEAIKNLVGESNFNLLKEEILAKEDTNEYLKLLLQKIGGFRYPVQYLKN